MKLSNDTPPATPLPTLAAAGGAGGAGPEKPTPQPTPPKPPPASASSAAQDTWQPRPPKEGGVVPSTGHGITTGPNGIAYGEWKVVPGEGTPIPPGTHAPPRGDAHTLVVTDASGQKHDIHQGAYKLPVRGQNEIWAQPMGFDQKIPVGEKPTGGKPRDIQSHRNGVGPNPVNNDINHLNRLALLTTASAAVTSFRGALDRARSSANYLMVEMSSSQFGADTSAQRLARESAQILANSIVEAKDHFNAAANSFRDIWTNNPWHEFAGEVHVYATTMRAHFQFVRGTIESAATTMRTWPAVSQQLATIDHWWGLLEQGANQAVDAAVRNGRR